jgi:hypothetical protein
MRNICLFDLRMWYPHHPPPHCDSERPESRWFSSGEDVIYAVSNFTAW